MNKQKIKPLDEERESRSLLSNAVVILHLVFGTLPLLLVVWAVDRLMSDTLTSTAIWMVGAAMLLFALLRGVFYGTSIWRAHRSAYNALTRLRLRIVSHLQRLPLGFFQERKAGDLVNIINHDVEQIEIYLAHGLPEILSATLFPALLWVIVMVLDWRLGLSLISLLPLAFLLQMAVKTFWGKSFRHFMENTQKMSEDLLEYVATIPIIKAFSHEETRTERVLGGMRDYIHWVKRSMFSVTVPMTLITMFLEGGIVVMTLVGLRLMSSGELTVARFILALILGGLFSYSFAKLATFQHFRIVYGQSLAKVQSITEVPAKDTADRDTDAMQTDVCFEHVTFAYPNKKDCALCDVNLQFPKGSHTAIVGEPCGTLRTQHCRFLFYGATRGIPLQHEHSGQYPYRQALRHARGGGNSCTTCTHSRFYYGVTQWLRYFGRRSRRKILRRRETAHFHCTDVAQRLADCHPRRSHRCLGREERETHSRSS